MDLTLARGYAHLRNPNMGARIWQGARYITPNRSRTVELHNLPQNVLPPEVARQTQLGSDFTAAEYTLPEQYPVRPPRLSSLFVSDPRLFQSYFKVHWEDLLGSRANLEEGTRRMTPLANPVAPGRAEGQAILPYNPFPSASALNPTYPYAEVKAI